MVYAGEETFDEMVSTESPAPGPSAFLLQSPQKFLITNGLRCVTSEQCFEKSADVPKLVLQPFDGRIKKGTAKLQMGGNRLFHPPLVYGRNTHLAILLS